MRLAGRLQDPGPDAIVLGLPRGGVPVAAEVARVLGAPLDVVVVRKLGAPGQPELAMGAVGPGGARVLNQRVIDALQVSDEALEEATRREHGQVDRRLRLFRGDHDLPRLAGRAVVLVDDGIATGSTMEAAARVVRQQGPARLVIAVPVMPPSARSRFEDLADEVVAVEEPDPFQAVGRFYEDFGQTTDDEVQGILGLREAVP